MSFPSHGHTRTRGMFRTLDAPNLRLALARFAPKDYVLKAMPVEPTMTGRDPWAADAGRRYLKPIAGKVYTATYSTIRGQRIDYEMLEARVFEHMLSRMEEGKPYRIQRIHDCIDLEPIAEDPPYLGEPDEFEPIAEERDADHATTA